VAFGIPALLSDHDVRPSLEFEVFIREWDNQHGPKRNSLDTRRRGG